MEVNKLKIGLWLVDPASLSLHKGETTTTLRLKAMSLLLKLAQSPGEVFTRDDLIDEIWPETAATDDTLNSTIAQLRKVLVSDDLVSKYIETIPKKGYRIIAPVELLDKTSTQLDITRKQGLFGNKKKFSFAISLVVLIFFWLSYEFKDAFNTAVTTPRYHASLFASQIAAEIYPQFSNTGERIVFVRADIDNALGHLVVKNIQTEQEQLLSDQALLIANPIWSPDDSEIAYLHFDSLGCHVNIVSSGGGPSRQVAPCSASLSATMRPALAWLPSGNTLVVSQNMPETNTPALFMVNLSKSGAEPVQISFPDDFAQGDSNQQISADGGTIAFTRTSSMGVDRIGTIELLSGKEQLFELPMSTVLGLTWSDYNKLVITSQLSGRSETWQLNTDNGKVSWLGIGGYDVVHIDFNPLQGSFVVAELKTDNNINIRNLELGEGNNLIEKISSRKNEHLVELSPDSEHIAFVREFGTKAELWLAETSAENSRRVLNLENSFIKSVQWSSNNKSLLVNVVKGANAFVYIYELGNAHFYQLDVLASEKIYSPIWGDTEQSIYYTTYNDDHWQIWRYQLDERIKTLITNKGGNKIQLDKDNNQLVFSHDTDLGLWSLPLQQGDKAIKPERKAGKMDIAKNQLFRHWQLVKDTLYYTLLSEPIAKNIYREKKGDEKREVYFSSEHLITQFDLQNNILATSETESRASDLYLYSRNE